MKIGMPIGFQLTVGVKTRFVAWHRWKDAPEKRAYLRNFHRHEFHVEAIVYVDHGERDVEFHDLKDEVNDYLTFGIHAWIGKQIELSCEQMAVMIGDHLSMRGFRPAIVRVSEDGECFADAFFKYPEEE